MKRLHAIDGLRGLAAVTVVLFHYSQFFASDVPYIRWGYLSVDLFFILSGYILSSRYLKPLQRGEVGAVEFVVRRIGWLWPLHVVALLILVFENWYFRDYLGRFTLFTGQSTPDYVSNAFLMQGFSNTGLIMNPPSWSITAEFVINLAWLGLVYVCWNPIVAGIVTFSGIASLLLFRPDLSVEPYLAISSWSGYLTHGVVRCAVGYSIG